jgi:hypothetical protein
MAKDPAMLWYWGDWYSGTVLMSRFLKGCYMDLLHAQFNSGRLTIEEIRMVLGSDFGQAWPTLQKKFAVDTAGKYFNERLEVEKNKRMAFTASRKKNLESHKDSDMDYHMHGHTDNINKNVNVINIKKEPLSKIDLFAALFDDELYVEDLGRTHKGKSLNQAFEECYKHHSVKPDPPAEVWEWKQKLNTWLINTKTNGNGNGIKKSDQPTTTIIDQGKSFGIEKGFSRSGANRGGNRGSS